MVLSGVKGKRSVPLFAVALFVSASAVPAADWAIETIDPEGTGRYASMRIDAAGNAHVTYIVDDLGHDLRYAFWDRAKKKWFTMSVDSGAAFCSLTLDSRQRPHISYNEYGTSSGSRLKYAYWNGTQWQRQAVPLDSDIVAYYTSIALDSEDRPTISFYEYRGRKDSDFHIRLRVVSWTGTFWAVRTVDGSEGSGKFNYLLKDSQSRLRLAYANVAALTAGARLATWDGQAWKLDVADDMASNQQQVVGYSLALALSKDDIPHLCYWNVIAPLVKYATIKNGRWVTEIVDRPGGPAYWDRNSIAVDDDGRPFLSYYDGRYGELRFAYKRGRNWAVEIVDGGFAGFTSSLQIAGDEIWIVYADEGNRSLKVARRRIADLAGSSRENATATSRSEPAPVSH